MVDNKNTIFIFFVTLNMFGCFYGVYASDALNSVESYKSYVGSEKDELYITFNRIKKGDELGVDYFLDVGVNSELIVSVDRVYLTDIFIENVICGRNKLDKFSNPFNKKGIDLILNDVDLKIILTGESSKGFYIRFRNGFKNNRNFKLFKTQNVKGVVEKVRGQVWYSSETSMIRKYYSNLFINDYFFTDVSDMHKDDATGNYVSRSVIEIENGRQSYKGEIKVEDDICDKN